MAIRVCVRAIVFSPAMLINSGTDEVLLDASNILLNNQMFPISKLCIEILL